MRNQKPAILIGLLILIFAIANVLATHLWCRLSDDRVFELLQVLLMPIWIGSLYAQMSLIGIYTTLNRGPLAIQLPGAFLLIACLCGSGLLGLSWTEHHGWRSNAFYCVMAFCTQAIVQIPLWIGVRFRDWKLAGEGESTDRHRAHEHQFSMKHLFVGIALLAAGMSLFRVILSGSPWDFVDLKEAALLGLVHGLIVTAILVPTLVFVRTVYQAESRIDALVSLLISVPLCVSFLEAVVIATILVILGVNNIEMGVMVLFFGLLVVNALHCTIVTGVLLLLHRVGIVWVSGNENIPETPIAD